MKLWSIQSEDVWTRLSQTGRYRTRRPPTLASARATAGLRRAFVWMTAQLTKRVGPPPAPGIWPVWAWYWWKDRDHPRPDLRVERHAYPRGARMVRIALEVPKDFVLLSDFNDWHFVLNNWYLSRVAAEADTFDHKEKRWPAAKVQAAKIESWARIFSLQRNFAAQAVLWELRKDWVTHVDYFVGARRSR